MTLKTMGWLLDQAIQWENTTHDFYVALAGAFAAHPDVHSLWLTMSADELGHAATLESVRAGLTGDELAAVLGNREIRWALAVDRLWGRVDTRPITTLDDAYELVHEIESSEISAVFNLVALESIDDAQRRAVLTQQFVEHTEQLEEFAKKFDRSFRLTCLPSGAISTTT